MKLILQREPSTVKSTPGKLYVDGEFNTFTLEDVIREERNPDGTLVPVAQWKVDFTTAIPSGDYEVVLDYSNRFKRIMPHILNVPGFDGIRIHWGNWAFNTEGCLLVGGVRYSTDEVLESKIAFDALFAQIEHAIKAAEEVRISILNPATQPLIDQPQTLTT